MEKDYDEIYKSLSCPKCGGESTMIHDETLPCYVCIKCGFAESDKFILREALGFSNEVDVVDRDWGEEYEDVYTEDGSVVNCDVCGAELKWRTYEYDKAVCPNCEQTMSRAALFNYIGIEPPGSECFTCGELYPGCADCPYGYDGEYKD